MPSDIFEEALEIEIGLLEAGTPTKDSYPYPYLTLAGSAEKRSFRAIILENPYLRATFLPALGGRLLSLIDKRTGIEVLPNAVAPAVGGRRGVKIDAGIQLHFDGDERLTSLAAVQFAAEEPDEDRPAGLWLGEAVSGEGLSWHLHVTMPEDRAELILEARVFNRTFEEIPYSGGLLLPSFETHLSDGSAFVFANRGIGVGLIPERGKWSGSSRGISRFKDLRTLAPRQLDTWTARLIPFSGLAGVNAVSLAGAICLSGDRVQLQVSEQLADHKMVLRTQTGETLEAPVTAYPEKMLEMQVPAGVNAVAVLGPHKNLVLRWDEAWQPLPGATAMQAKVVRRASHPPTRENLEESTFDIATRHLAHARLGVLALAEGDLAEADYRFEQSLLFNGEDHLTWWMKAIAKRMTGEQTEEVPELLNAHYLAPLDPVLRAESFLGQGLLEKEPSALLKSMADFPDNFVEVAALLVEANLFEQASRWIDEALRHIDMPMLRYLLAYAHLQGTTMDFEVAKLIMGADAVSIGPPYPWRKIEIEAIRSLVARFPENARLQSLAEIIGQLRS